MRLHQLTESDTPLQKAPRTNEFVASTKTAVVGQNISSRPIINKPATRGLSIRAGTLHRRATVLLLVMGYGGVKRC